MISPARKEVFNSLAILTLYAAGGFKLQYNNKYIVWLYKTHFCFYQLPFKPVSGLSCAARESNYKIVLANARHEHGEVP